MDKPKILWLVSVTLPGAARALGLAGAIGGGWVEGQLCAVKDQALFTVCTVNSAAKRPLYAEADGVTYAVLPRGSSEEFSALLQKVKPDLVHLWGSEYPPAPALLALCRPERVLLSVQGLMGPCAEHLLDGVPPQYRTSCAAQRMIDRVVPGGLLDKQQAFFDAQAEREKALLSQLRHISGRTAWDRAELAHLAPNARYYHCGETLRPAFYAAPDEEDELQNDKSRPDKDGPVLLLSQGNLPLKGLHRLIEALPAVRAACPRARLRVAGWPPLDKGPLLRGVIRWMFPYQRYCAELAARLGVADMIRYTDPLDAAAMRRQYLAADVFLLCSSIENSPNSLGEAMLLGRPCVASRVGGVPSLLKDGREGLLYPADDPAALASAILALLNDPARAAAMGKAARARALKNHDPAQNARDLLAIYRRMLDGQAGGPDAGQAPRGEPGAFGGTPGSRLGGEQCAAKGESGKETAG